MGASISGLQESIDSWKVALDSGPGDLSYEPCLVEFAPAQAELYLVKLKNLVACISGLQESIDSGMVALDRGPGALI